MAGVEVTFLGCGDAFGSGGRFQTCFMIRAGQTRFLVDCGASSLIAMRRLGVQPNDIDMILVSHLHGDHFGGIPFFILDAQLISKRSRPLRIAGPPGLAKRIREAMEVLFPGSSQVRHAFAIDFEALAPGESRSLGAVRVTPYEVSHPSGAPAFALRIECGGRTVAYTGDTEWCEALIPAAREADLLIAEAYFYDKKVKFHLDLETLRAHLDELRPKRLILTHMSADMLARVNELDIECAEDGKTVSL